MHMKIHTCEKQSSCSTCFKSFGSSGYLKIHMRIHTGDKPFAFPHCPKSWTQNCNLTRHLKIHKGKDINCPELVLIKDIPLLAESAWLYMVLKLEADIFWTINWANPTFSNNYNSVIFKVKIYEKISRHWELQWQFKNAKMFEKQIWEDFFKNIFFSY